MHCLALAHAGTRWRTLAYAGIHWHTLAYAELRSALTPNCYFHCELTIDKASQVSAEALPKGVPNKFAAHFSCLIMILIAF
jgi:hypothetical protein